MEHEKLRKLTCNIGDMALKRRVERIIAELDIKATDTILDCGCGDGLYLKTIRELGEYNILGFDLNGFSLKLAQGYISEYPAPLIQGSVCELPFEDNTFDKIFSTEVIEHIPDDRRALQEIYRVLKPGGILIVTVPNHNYPFMWDPLNWVLERMFGTYIKSGLWAGIWNMHLRLYYPQEIASLIEESGFDVVRVEPVTHYCVPFNHIILYGLKALLNTGVLPEAVSNSADKFAAKERKQSRLVKFGYAALNTLDKLNDQLPAHKSSSSVLVKSVKNEVLCDV